MNIAIRRSVQIFIRRLNQKVDAKVEGKKIMQVVTDRQTEGEKKSRGSLLQLSSQTVVENTVDLLAVLEVESAILPG